VVGEQQLRAEDVGVPWIERKDLMALAIDADGNLPFDPDAPHGLPLSIDCSILSPSAGRARDREHGRDVMHTARSPSFRRLASIRRGGEAVERTDRDRHDRGLRRHGPPGRAVVGSLLDPDGRFNHELAVDASIG
jgi:hypothetical protein